MNPQYKEYKNHKVVGENDTSRFSEGDPVSHWFAGKGEVIGIKNSSVVKIKWDDGQRGAAYAKHLRKVNS